MTPEQLLGAARPRLRGIIAGRAVVRLTLVTALCTLSGVLAARWIAWQPTELLALLVPLVVPAGRLPGVRRGLAGVQPAMGTGEGAAEALSGIADADGGWHSRSNWSTTSESRFFTSAGARCS